MSKLTTSVATSISHLLSLLNYSWTKLYIYLKFTEILTRSPFVIIVKQTQDSTKIIFVSVMSTLFYRKLV